MDKDAFSKSPSGIVRKIGKGDEAYWAFIPNALPPKLDLTVELVAALSEADRALGELAGLGRNLPNADLLIRPFARREAVLSSRIEGTETDLRELYEFEVDEATRGEDDGDGKRSDAREVLNYVQAMEQGIKRLETLPVSLRLLRELHATLLHGVRGRDQQPGEFRLKQNWIGSPNCAVNEARFVPPPPDQLKDILGALELYLHAKDQLPPLIRLALIHYQFETIHPFLDGNGRIGRLLMVLLLVHWKLLPAPLLYLSAWFERHRQQYYDHLLAVSQRGTWHAWLLYFLEGVKQESVNAKERAAKLLAIQRGWRELVGKKKGTAKMLAVVDMLMEQPVVNAAAVQKQLGCTHMTAITTLRRLAKIEIVVEVAWGHQRKGFVATAILDVAS